MAKPLHVLVVEDDDAVRDALRMVLNEFGYRVSQAGNAAAARIVLGHRDVDLLITDELMLGEKGRQLAEYARTLGVNVLLMSADNDLKNKLAAGHLPFIGKPFRVDQLREAVERALPKSKADADGD